MCGCYRLLPRARIYRHLRLITGLQSRHALFQFLFLFPHQRRVAGEELKIRSWRNVVMPWQFLEVQFTGVYDGGVHELTSDDNASKNFRRQIGLRHLVQKLEGYRLEKNTRKLSKRKGNCHSAFISRSLVYKLNFLDEKRGKMHDVLWVQFQCQVVGGERSDTWLQAHLDALRPNLQCVKDEGELSWVRCCDLVQIIFGVPFNYYDIDIDIENFH